MANNPAILWLQDESGIAGQVGVFLSTRKSPGVWSRTMVYDFFASPPPGVTPATMDLTNISVGANVDASLTSHPGFLFGVTGYLASPNQNLSVCVALAAGATQAKFVDTADSACVDLYYREGANPQGAWLINGKYYIALQLPAQFTADGNDHVRVFSSPDMVAWTGLDIANEISFPAGGGGGFNSGAFDIDLAGKKLHCVVQFDTATIALMEFDFSTEKWIAAHDAWGFRGGGGTPVFGVPDIVVYSHSANVTHLILDNGGTPVYWYFDGVNWNNPAITIPSVTNWDNQYQWGIIDPNGTTVHFVLGHQYVQILSGGVLGTTFDFNATSPGGFITFGGRGMIQDDALFIPVTNDSSGNLYCVIATPLSSPSFSAELVDTAFAASGGVAEECSMYAVASSPSIMFQPPRPQPERIKH